MAIHPSEPLGRAAFAMLHGLSELNGTDPAAFTPTTPADFFKLVGMDEWAALDQTIANRKALR